MKSCYVCLLPALAGAAPIVLTPETVSWESVATATGQTTIFSLSGDAVLEWDVLRLEEGDEIVFDFANPTDSVANLLGTGDHWLDGRVTSNGSVGFFAAGNLSIGGELEARNVTISALPIGEIAGFLVDGGVEMDGAFLQRLTVDGSVRATAGDVRLAADVVNVRGGARLSARESVRIGAGRNVTFGPDARTRVEGGAGVLLHLGRSEAARIELVAAGGIVNAGRLTANSGYGQVFLEVGSGGSIRNEGTGSITGQVVVMGDFDNGGVIIGPDEGDTLQVVNASVIRIPAVKRPDGSVASGERELETHATISGSADALRVPVASGRQRIVRREKPPLLQKQSFFGMRGGSEKKR